MISYDLSNISVLIVEKHSHMRTILRQVLRQFGVPNVFDASEPAIGFQRYKDFYPDIVLLDWGPDFDGLALLSKIRAGSDAGNPWVPVIMCTANTEKCHIVEARDVGATEYLLKPVSAKSIYDRIVSVIDDARLFVRTKSFTGPDRRRNDMPYGDEERRKENLAIEIPKPKTEEDTENKESKKKVGRRKKKKKAKKSTIAETAAPEENPDGGNAESMQPETPEPMAAARTLDGEGGEDGETKADG
jgi:two-component system, chemotaxis family, chemotaxis protein CheY